jgi:hypothetical protein
MNLRLAAIEARRARLIERAALEREDVAQTVHSLSQPLGVVDRCLGALRYFIAHPPLVVGATLLFALLRPLRTLKWARRAWGLWQSYRWLTQKKLHRSA